MLGYLQNAVRESLLCFPSNSFITNIEKYHLNTEKYHFDPIKAQRQISKVLKSKVTYSKYIIYVINHANFELHREYSDRVNLQNWQLATNIQTNEFEFCTSSDVCL